MEDTQIKVRTKKDADLRIPLTDRDPEGHRFYHPAIGRNAVIWGLIGGAVVGLFAWLMAHGTIAINGLGQLGTSGEEVAAFFGFAIGSSISGLAGALVGMSHLFRE